MSAVLFFLLSVAVGFLIGCVYEGCRRGGTIDLHAQLARRRP